MDEFIDVIQSNRVYLKCLYVYNKIDQLSIEEIDRKARVSHTVVISCEMGLNLDYLLEKIWEYLALIRVYTKKPGNRPDLGKTEKKVLKKYFKDPLMELFSAHPQLLKLLVIVCIGL